MFPNIHWTSFKINLSQGFHIYGKPLQNKVLQLQTNQLKFIVYLFVQYSKWYTCPITLSKRSMLLSKAAYKIFANGKNWWWMNWMNSIWLCNFTWWMHIKAFLLGLLEIARKIQQISMNVNQMLAQKRSTAEKQIVFYPWNGRKCFECECNWNWLNRRFCCSHWGKGHTELRIFENKNAQHKFSNYIIEAVNRMTWWECLSYCAHKHGKIFFLATDIQSHYRMHTPVTSTLSKLITFKNWHRNVNYSEITIK